MGVTLSAGEELTDKDSVCAEVSVESAVAVTVEVEIPDTVELKVGVGDFKTATLRLRMVALDTPASLASQE